MGHDGEREGLCGQDLPRPDDHIAATHVPVAPKQEYSRWLIALALFGLMFAALHQLTLADRVAKLEQKARKVSLFAAPADLEWLRTKVYQSTVVIHCFDVQGSGWVIDLGSPPDDADEEELRIDRMFPTEVITNHHVIKDCVEKPGKVRATADGRTLDAWLYSWDEKNDLAIVSIMQEIPALKTAGKPTPGMWAMAVGAPYGLEGSVSLGNIMNVDGTDVVSTTPLNSGNSGGPLVNARGDVLGTNTWSMVSDGTDDPQDWNVAVGVPALCEYLVDCDPADSTLIWK